MLANVLLPFVPLADIPPGFIVHVLAPELDHDTINGSSRFTCDLFVVSVGFDGGVAGVFTVTDVVALVLADTLLTHANVYVRTPSVVNVGVCQLPEVPTDTFALPIVWISHELALLAVHVSVLRLPCSIDVGDAVKLLINGFAGGAGEVGGVGAGGGGGGAGAVIVGPTPGYCNAPRSCPVELAPMRLAMSLGIVLPARNTVLSLRIR